VAYFIEPILAHHDPDRFEIYCYAQVGRGDVMTERLQALAGHWRRTLGMSDAELAAQVRADGIDILVDLAGHTANSRLTAFTSRPAPVQIGYLGYPNTICSPAIAYRLTDAWADPPGQEQFHCEELIRLPRGFLCYAPSPDAPAVTPPPSLTNGHITFGSFNNLAKINTGVVALWARLLQAEPTARLVIKNGSLRDPATRERYHALFQQHGIARARVDLAAWTPAMRDHLAAHAGIDIGLDTFPYNGTTTTCEALWMGVPVVALAGDRHASRVGVSLLTRLGLTELIAETLEHYIRVAQYLSANPARLSELRHGLRARIQASTLCDGAAFTRELEDTYRELWRRWCENA
jgi:predicted O-linked N-acetylglucosamine transferase (SPINDLY family)